MELDMSKITKDVILLVSRYVLLFILLLQLSVPGFALTLGADNPCALSSFSDESSLASILCIEDIEDESIDYSSKFLNEFSFGESKFLSQNNDLPKNYIHPQLYSRSPPGIQS